MDDKNVAFIWSRDESGKLKPNKVVINDNGQLIVNDYNEEDYGTLLLEKFMYFTDDTKETMRFYGLDDLPAKVLADRGIFFDGDNATTKNVCGFFGISYQEGNNVIENHLNNNANVDENANIDNHETVNTNLDDSKNKAAFIFGDSEIEKVIIYKDNKIIIEDFDYDAHAALLYNNLKANDRGLVTDFNNMTSEEIAERGFFHKDDAITEKIFKYFGLPNPGYGVIEEHLNSDNVENNANINEDTNTDNQENENTNLDDEYVDDNENDFRLGKRVLAAVLAAGAVVGGLSLFHACSDENIEEVSKEKSLEDLLNEMTPTQKSFFMSSINAVETFNNNTIKENNFKLEQDASNLHMTVDEAIALNIVLNNYSAEDLYEIFGTVEFDTTNVMNLARSAYSKLSTYYMNAKEPSGLSVMINDQVSREFFEKHENAVIEFNNNPSVELTDVVVKGLYYDYVVNGSTGEYAKINNDGVAWLSTSAGFGYELANRNVEEFLRINNVSEDEIEKYEDAAARVGLSLNEITTSELLTGINEEISIDIMDEIDNKSLCASVTSQTKDKIDSLTLKQQIASTIIETNAKDSLVEGLRESGYINLANKVIVSEMTDELLDEVASNNAKTNELVEEYKNRLNSLTNKEAKVMAILNLAMEKYNSKEEINIAELVNNRFRTPMVVEKEQKPVVDTTPGATTKEEKEKLKEELYVGEDENGTPVYDGNKFNELPEDKQKEFVKDNGVVVDKKEEVTEEVPVQKEDLTPEEVKEVVSQENILTEIDKLENKLYEQGKSDAMIYVNEKGAYEYSGEIVIKLNSQKIDTKNLSLANIAQLAYAYENVEISIEDKQIQERMSNDAKKAETGSDSLSEEEKKEETSSDSLSEEEKKEETSIDSLSEEAKKYLSDKYGSNWRTDFINESYVKGYKKVVESTLEKAKENGIILRDETEKMYFDLLEQQNKSEEQVNSTGTKEEEVETKESNDSTPSNNNTSEDYDPNLDPNYKAKDEESYNPMGYYVENVTPNAPSSKTYDENLDTNYAMDDEIVINAMGSYVNNSSLEDAFNEAVGSKVK